MLGFIDRICSTLKSREYIHTSTHMIRPYPRNEVLRKSKEIERRGGRDPTSYEYVFMGIEVFERTVKFIGFIVFLRR